MIFEINYNELQAPLAMIKELLTDKEYKGDVKRITLQVTKEKVFVYYHDDRLNLRIRAELDGADAQLPGMATCSFATFFETVKVFKKSDEPILIERENDHIRVDDGIYPEETVTLREDEDVNELPDTALIEKFAGVRAECLRDGIQLATAIVRKTEIPSESVDTQGVYLGAKGDFIEFTSFSLHGFQRSKRLGVVYREHMLALPKPVASALAKVAHTGRNEIAEWTFSEGDAGEEAGNGLLVESDNGMFAMFFALETKQGNQLAETFRAVEANFLETMASCQLGEISDVTSMGKVKTDDNVLIVDGVAVVNPSGYPAQMVRKLWDKGAWEESGKVFYSDGGNGQNPVLCLYSNEKSGEKMTSLSYRVAPNA